MTTDSTDTNFVIPQHDEPEAVEKLISALKRIFAGMRTGECRRSFFTGASLVHPPLGIELMSFLNDSQRLFGAPLLVEVLQDLKRSDAPCMQAYLFCSNGEVKVKERQPSGEVKLMATLTSWPYGVAHMFKHVNNILLQSIAWEQQTAGKLQDLLKILPQD